MNTQTELARPFGHRDARTNLSNQPLFICLQQDRATPKKAYSAGALTFFGLLFNFHFEIRLAPGLWTLRPLRSGFEPLTQGFSVLCSNQLSYLNHLPKVCFLQGDFQSFALTS